MSKSAYGFSGDPYERGVSASEYGRTFDFSTRGCPGKAREDTLACLEPLIRHALEEKGRGTPRGS
jgi:hypothetical protein